MISPWSEVFGACGSANITNLGSGKVTHDKTSLIGVPGYEVETCETRYYNVLLPC